MAFQATVINVMIASPGDVINERNEIRRALHEWNAIHAIANQVMLNPLSWEGNSAPMTGDRGQGIINRQLVDHCDLLVAVFWTRLGSPTGVAPSGTIEEIERHLEANRPAMIYFSNAPVAPDCLDQRQYKSVQKAKDEFRKRGLIEEFENFEDFQRKFGRQLATIVNEFSAADSRPNPVVPDLSDEAKTLLIEASRHSHGIVMHATYINGGHVQAGNKVMSIRTDHKSERMWVQAIHDLVANGYLEAKGDQNVMFEVTHAGYKCAEQLSTEMEVTPKSAILTS